MLDIDTPEKRKKIIFKFNPAENVRIETDGFEGDTCLQAIDKISEALPEGMKLIRNKVTMKLLKETGLDINEENINRMQNLCG